MKTIWNSTALKFDEMRTVVSNFFSTIWNVVGGQKYKLMKLKMSLAKESEVAWIQKFYFNTIGTIVFTLLQDRRTKEMIRLLSEIWRRLECQQIILTQRAVPAKNNFAHEREIRIKSVNLNPNLSYIFNIFSDLQINLQHIYSSSTTHL